MNLKDAKVGTEVKVVSEFGVCGVDGYIGKISKVIDSSSYVYVLFDILPCYYGGDNPVRISSKSLELVNKVEVEPEVEDNLDDVRIGVFYTASFADDFEKDNYFSTNKEVLIVREKSKEACMKILADLIADGYVDDEEYDTFVFDNQKYKIKAQVSVVIDDD
jgi:hypothetical protein